MTQTVPAGAEESALIARLGTARTSLLGEIGKAIVGQHEVLEQLLIALLCRGHCLLEGVPGLAKTAMVQALARSLDLQFSRIQFTPDLMPSDITGTDLVQEDPETGRRQFEFMRGPLFANLVLADEINRTPPKTQAALLEAMQERRATVRGHTWDLPDPFLVLATQNPIEQEGTYPLPEAQLDRFMFMIRIGYPSRAEEVEILRRTTGGSRPQLTAQFTAAELVRLQETVRQVPVPDQVFEHAVDLVAATRPAAAPSGQPATKPGSGTVATEVTRWLQWGAGPRAGQMLILGAKARALLAGRFHVERGDIDALAAPVLRHRIVPTFAAQAEGLSADALVSRLVALRRAG
ncbi:ATPase AAA [Planctomycetota bacterium]|nr:ATPase AAA [Planctomycetota bacterium]